MSLHAPSTALSLFKGPEEPKLVSWTIGDLLQRQALELPFQNAIISQGSKVRITYGQLNENTKLLGRALLASGIHKGDRIGIFAGNEAEYVAVVLAAARIGAIAVLLNTFYTTEEIKNALSFTGNSIQPVTKLDWFEFNTVSRLLHAVHRGNPREPRFITLHRRSATHH
jgi:acyl-CoA synthetase (AMP-forming)/AMP-acid ligase II